MFGRLLMLAGVVLLSAAVNHCSRMQGALGNRELVMMKERNNFLYHKLISEKCPAPDSVTQKISLLGKSENSLLLEIEEELHGKLLGMLIKCLKNPINNHNHPYNNRNDSLHNLHYGPIPSRMSECKKPHRAMENRQQRKQLDQL